MEQQPGNKTQEQIEKEVKSKCCLCRNKCTSYKGKFKCCQSLCGVPVIVCSSCESLALREPSKLTCELCKSGYRAPEALPDLVGMKRKADSLISTESDKKRMISKMEPFQTHEDRLFLARLPLTVTRSKLGGVFGQENIKFVHWLTDKTNGAFYGSCIIQMNSAKAAKEVLEKGRIKMGKKKVRVCLAHCKEGEQWPPASFKNKEFPPIGT